MAILDVQTFKTATIMPSKLVEQLEEERPGFLDASIASWTSELYARLGKRYGKQWASGKVPPVVVGWLVRLVTRDAYGAIGHSVTSEQDKAQILDPAERALAMMLEVANSETGLLDVPAADGELGGESGINLGGPYSYSEATPYEWLDAQRESNRGR